MDNRLIHLYRSPIPVGPVTPVYPVLPTLFILTL